MADTTNALCPLCEGPNQCAMAHGATDASGCWCAKANVPIALGLCVPRERAGACICQRCVESPRADPVEVAGKPHPSGGAV